MIFFMAGYSDRLVGIYAYLSEYFFSSIIETTSIDQMTLIPLNTTADSIVGRGKLVFTLIRRIIVLLN